MVVRKVNSLEPVNGVVTIPDATTSIKGISALHTSVDSTTNKAVTPSAVQTSISNHNNILATSSIKGHVQVDGTTITVSNGVISAVQPTIINNLTSSDATKALSANQGRLLNNYISNVEQQFDNNIMTKVKINRITVKSVIPSNATPWVLDFSSITGVTNLSKYVFNIYDDGVLIQGGTASFVVNNATRTITITPTVPMSRSFTLTAVGHGIELI